MMEKIRRNGKNLVRCIKKKKKMVDNKFEGNYIL
jgi:hypothetical protein